MAEKQTFPMISEGNWRDLRNQFKKTIPTVVNTSYVKTLLGFKSEDSARNNVISPLKQVGLIDEEGKPTPLATDWRSDDKYFSACQTMLKSLYPQELLDLFPDDDIDPMQVRAWFMDTASIGQSAAGKASNTFLFIKRGKLEQPSASQNSKTSTSKTPKRPVKQDKTSNKANVAQPANNVLIATDNTQPVIPDIHIDMQVHISPEASPEQIDMIFESMARHLYGKK